MVELTLNQVVERLRDYAINPQAEENKACPFDDKEQEQVKKLLGSCTPFMKEHQCPFAHMKADNKAKEIKSIITQIPNLNKCPACNHSTMSSLLNIDE